MNARLYKATIGILFFGAGVMATASSVGWDILPIPAKCVLVALTLASAGLGLRFLFSKRSYV